METNLEIVKEDVKGSLVQTVNARELHRKLGIKLSYVDWMQNKVLDHPCKNSLDYLIKIEKIKDGPQYYLSINTARELCMLEKTELGRKYFTELEKYL
jgi:anti-repressor protein